MTMRQIEIPSSTNPVSERFNKIKLSTHCPFAERSKIWTADEWKNDLSFEENMTTVAIRLKDFTEKSFDQKLDGFVIEIHGEDYSRNLPSLCHTLKSTLISLSKSDPMGKNSMDNEIMDVNWQFEFNNERLFLITFAPFYQESHPRFSPIQNSIFIFLQPESSFDFNIAPPPGDPKVIKLKAKIRSDFENNGQSYDHGIADLPYEALKYIKPLNIGDDPVYWWRDE